MKLVSFGVQRYRSIIKATHLPVHDGVTVLVGPNNEGKSNLLRGLVTAMEVVKRLNFLRVSRYGRLLGMGPYGERYIWEKDFPITLQAGSPSGESHFDLEFELTAKDIADFKSEVGSAINDTLPLRLSIGQGEPSFSVLKQGPAKKRLAVKRHLVAAFIGKRVDFQYRVFRVFSGVI
jgi:putative ATP-dependent endonuclease of the OLD family